jgi:hypothetical protein
MWFYSIHGTGNRSVLQSEAIYETEQLAQTAGTEYLKNNQASIHREHDAHEIFTLASCRLTAVLKQLGLCGIQR